MEVACFIFALQGCSIAIAAIDRLGPDPDKTLNVGSSRSDVEQELGKPIVSETLDAGRVKATYEYTARVGSLRGKELAGFATVAVVVDMLTFGVAELFMPSKMASEKRARTYQKEFVYGPDGNVSERNETDEPFARAAAPWYRRSA